MVVTNPPSITDQLLSGNEAKTCLRTERRGRGSARCKSASLEKIPAIGALLNNIEPGRWKHEHSNWEPSQRWLKKIPEFVNYQLHLHVVLVVNYRWDTWGI